MSSKDFGPCQMADHLGASHGQIDRARELGLLREPDVDGKRWSAAAVSRIRCQWPQILAGIEANREWGAWRCAGLLAELTGLDVDGADVEELAARGLVEVSGYYKERPLYPVAGIENLAGDPDCVGMLTDVVLERRAWLAASLPRYEAAKRLGWSVREFEQAAGTHGVTPGRFDRYALADIERLAADELLAEAIRGNRLLGPDQAAEHLEVRRTDFDYCVAAGWITPAGHADTRISRRRTISVPLYRVRDVKALRDVPGVDWEAVRAARPGVPSPLREFTRLPIGRAALVRGFAADLAARYGTEVTARYDDTRDRWELTWAPGVGQQPDRDTVRALLRRDRDLAPHAASIGLRLLPAGTQAPDAECPEPSAGVDAGPR